MLWLCLSQAGNGEITVDYWYSSIIVPSWLSWVHGTWRSELFCGCHPLGDTPYYRQCVNIVLHLVLQALFKSSNSKLKLSLRYHCWSLFKKNFVLHSVVKYSSLLLLTRICLLKSPGTALTWQLGICEPGANFSKNSKAIPNKPSSYNRHHQKY